MILSDGEIQRRIQRGEIVIEPLEDTETQIQPASVDLRLGQNIIRMDDPDVDCIRIQDEDTLSTYGSEKRIDKDSEFYINPGDFVLGTTVERVEIPPSLVGHIRGRSSVGRLGVIVHATAGLIDPGYRGEITLELSNLGSTPVALTPGMRIAQLTLTELTAEAERPYGTERNSKYQDQHGPQASKIHDDPDIRNS